jgi:NAD-dependent SIR2 family protein deacetylase
MANLSISKIDEKTFQTIDQAADLLLMSNTLFISSGAGLGVSSGLGTFRGINAGVWPPLINHPHLDFTDMSNPSWFNAPQGNRPQQETANFAYAFWSYRYNAYTSAEPHRGYQIALQWSTLPQIKSSFSFTSNIDGQWIKAGWPEDRLHECHGSIHLMQCSRPCSTDVWPTGDALKLNVDPITHCAIDPLPLCARCQSLARPNVLMFNDWNFVEKRHQKHRNYYNSFVKSLKKAETKLFILELGAGTAVPTVRIQSEHMFSEYISSASFVRINPSAEDVSIPNQCPNDSKGKALEIQLDALTALILIDERVKYKQIQSNE